jgi:hypothetical protein
MKALLRQLERLEAGLAPLARVPLITAVALQTGGDDLVLVDGQWLSCPDVAVALEQPSVPANVYIGFGPREIFA